MIQLQHMENIIDNYNMYRTKICEKTMLMILLVIVFSFLSRFV